MKITATELNKRPGTYMEKALEEPVVIEKSGRPFMVMVPYARYVAFEDAYWGKCAIEADKEPSIGIKETMNYLLSEDGE